MHDFFFFINLNLVIHTYYVTIEALGTSGSDLDCTLVEGHHYLFIQLIKLYRIFKLFYVLIKC